METSTRCLRGSVVGRNGDHMMGRSWDVYERSVIHAFKSQLKNKLNILYQVIQDFIGNDSSKKFS